MSIVPLINATITPTIDEDIGNMETATNSTNDYELLDTKKKSKNKLILYKQ